MNYYSIEFFKHYLKIVKNNADLSSYDAFKRVENAIEAMTAFVKDREKNNESAYAKKWMKKPVFND